jgi:hypothetical protein
MYELTTEEHNFLRWLLEGNIDTEDGILINAELTDYQRELLDSIRAKLLQLSSY